MSFLWFKSFWSVSKHFYFAFFSFPSKAGYGSIRVGFRLWFDISRLHKILTKMDNWGQHLKWHMLLPCFAFFGISSAANSNDPYFTFKKSRQMPKKFFFLRFMKYQPMPRIFWDKILSIYLILISFFTEWMSNFQFRAKKIDVISRVLFPGTFLFFNIIYWSYYLSQDTDQQGNKK